MLVGQGRYAKKLNLSVDFLVFHAFMDALLWNMYVLACTFHKAR